MEVHEDAPPEDEVCQTRSARLRHLGARMVAVVTAAGAPRNEGVYDNGD